MTQSIREKISASWLWLGWWATLAAIPILSLSGRTLQRHVDELSLREVSGLLLLLARATLVYLAGHWLYHRRGRSGLWHLIWLLPLYVVYPSFLPFIAERLHFLVFGIFGFLSVQLFQP